VVSFAGLRPGGTRIVRRRFLRQGGRKTEQGGNDENFIFLIEVIIKLKKTFQKPLTRKNRINYG
jgi:hypothetical protein